jgi:ABC-type bacteriocin/lantibiotic exporter with double-glycine peptidase domain
MKSVKQRDQSDCGVACLAAVASHYDMRLSVAQIRQLTGTDQSGTSIFGLVQASKQLGFIARGLRPKLTSCRGSLFQQSLTLSSKESTSIT